MFKTILFGIVLILLAFSRPLFFDKTHSSPPSNSLVYKPSVVTTITTTAGEKRRYSF